MLSPKVIKLTVGQLQSNCYIYEVGDCNAIIVDPGDDDSYIASKLTEQELTPVAILATHGHFDHILSGFSLQAIYNIPFYIHKGDEFLLNRMRETAIHFNKADPGPPPIVTKFFDVNTKEFLVPSATLKIIQTPGHTPGSVSYYNKKVGVLFVGDLLFADGTIGEVTHSYSSRADSKASIKKILRLPVKTKVYFGHGQSSTVFSLREKFKWALL